jgi:two-component system, NarL family, response regulator LiaR
VRAIVADDDPFARRTIKDVLRRAGITVVAEARDGREAVECCLRLRPDVVLMDVVMPDLDGIAATRRILKHMPDQVIVLLTNSDEDDVGIVGLRAGAAGFLTKDLDIDMLPQALRGAHAGEAVISRRFGMRLVEALRGVPSQNGLRLVDGSLTPRQWEVLELISAHKTTEQIAEALVLSPETVRSHVKHILRKLGARSREEAIAIVSRMRGAA